MSNMRKARFHHHKEYKKGFFTLIKKDLLFICFFINVKTITLLFVFIKLYAVHVSRNLFFKVFTGLI
jgi:hypothetical protein